MEKVNLSNIKQEYENNLISKGWEELQRFLQTSSRGNLYRYAVNNQILIYMQNPHADMVASYNTWKDEGYILKKRSAIYVEKDDLTSSNYVFDATSAINLPEEEKDRLLWAVSAENEEVVNKAFINHADDLYTTICDVTEKCFENTFGVSGAEEQRMFATECAKFVLLNRCGYSYEVDERVRTLSNEECVVLFHENYPLVHEYCKNMLGNIGLVVKKYEREREAYENSRIRDDNGRTEEVPAGRDGRGDNGSTGASRSRRDDGGEVERDSEQSVVKQAEMLINNLESERTIFTDEERNLIINYAYKLDNPDKTRELAERLAMYERISSPELVAQSISGAQAEIDALPDGMIGLSEMHQYGYTWERMLPLTKERALELFSEDFVVYRLYTDGAEATVESEVELKRHEGLFGVEKNAWDRYLMQVKEKTMAYTYAEPTVTIMWSESDKLYEGEIMGLSKANELFGKLDKSEDRVLAYEKTQFRIDFMINGKLESYDGRQDLGDGDGTLIEHIEKYHAYYDNNQKWYDYVLKNEGAEALREEKEQRHAVLQELVPYLKLHNNLSKIEETAKEAVQISETLSKEGTEYYKALQEYVQECRGMLNQGNVNFPPVPRREDYVVENNEYLQELQEYMQYIREEEKDPEQVAFAILDKFVSIQTGTNGYDYSIYDENYKLLDGGVYDNPEISIFEALKEILADVEFIEQDEHVWVPVEYWELTEKAETVEMEALERNRIIVNFKSKTGEMFHDIDGQQPEDVERTVYEYVISKLNENQMDTKILGVVVTGSRCRGLEHDNSDIDVVVEYKGVEREDTLFNLLNDGTLKIGGIPVDINPITEEKTGTLATYLPEAERYLTEKRENMQKEAEKEISEKKIVTLSVSECSEFHELGEYYYDISSVEEAVSVFERMQGKGTNGVPGIGIRIHTDGKPELEDVEMDIMSGNNIHLDILKYVPDIADNERAMDMIAELVEKMPNANVHGSLEDWNLGKKKSENVTHIEDFGEKIGGARKDVWMSRGGLRMDDIMDLSEYEKEQYITKDIVWPKPDYEKLVDEGLPVECVYFIKKIRDALPAKPNGSENRKKELQNNYVEFVSFIKNLAMSVRSKNDVENFYMNNLVKSKFIIDAYRLVVPEDGYEQVITNKLVKAVQSTWHKLENEVKEKQFLYTDDEKLLSHFEILKYDNKTLRFEKNGDKPCLEKRTAHSTRWYYMDRNPAHIDINENTAKPDTWIVFSKGTPDWRMYGVQGFNYESEAEAKAAAVKIARAFGGNVKKKASRKGKYTCPALESVQRIGPPYVTMGREIEGKDFLRDFGIRGGEFGNWLTEKDRQANLNMAYEAFYDLADAMNMELTDISLGGRLAIAFGARGRGNALAHYEPMLEVINLTKLHGAGSLSHEWGHALDDICMKTDMKWYKEIRQELLDVMKCPNGRYGEKSKFYQNSVAMDMNYSKCDKGYWASDEEMFARAFACYVTDKLKALGGRNDYLSGHSEYPVENPPIPLGEERKTINEALDNFMEKVKERGIVNKYAMNPAISR